MISPKKAHMLESSTCFYPTTKIFLFVVQYTVKSEHVYGKEEKANPNYRQIFV